jgi:D-alanyl-D-alanine dipeptidase
MKRAFNPIALALLLACASAPHIPANRYGLQVVPDAATYEQQVRANPEKRLVDLQSFIPGVVLDIRYATTNNFMHEQLYPIAKAYARYPAAVALRDVQNELAKENLGLKIFDAYRPYGITEKMWSPKNVGFVADPAKGSKHNRGAAVDLTLIDLRTGQELEMPSAYDEFTDRAHRDYMAATPLALANRAKLEDIMKRHGFEPLPTEWWHFDFGGWERFELMNVTLEALEARDHRY